MNERQAKNLIIWYVGLQREQMERKSGFKECPRCGLRNKPSAALCDFCGWGFQDVSDEWISHVQVLEKLNREINSIVLDDEVSKRIESTIVRSTRESQPVLRPEPKLVTSKVMVTPAVASTVTKEDAIEADLRLQGKEWVTPIPATMAMPAADAKEVKTFVDTMIGEPVAAEAAAVVTVQSGDMAAVQMGYSGDLGQLDTTDHRTFKVSNYSMAFIGAGAALYLITLALYSMALLSVVMGWSIAIIGALMITVGASFIYDQKVALKGEPEPVIGRNTRAGDEVIICPRCHEEVDDTDERCPSCGAAFAH